MDKMNITSLLKLIKSAKKIAIVPHTNPDADAIGSSLGLYWILKALKKDDVRLVLEDKQPFDFEFLQGLDKFERSEDLNADLTEPDLIFFLDGNTSKRFTAGELDLDSKKKIVRIDHHASETDIESDVSFVEQETASSSEIVFRIFEGEVDIDSNTAKCLLMGIYDDTNSFSVENTSKSTFEIVAKLVEKGAKVMEIAEAINTYDETILNGTKAFVNNLKFDDKHKYAYTYISRDLYEMLELDGAKIDVIFNLILNILLGRKGYDWGFVVRPRSGGTTKVSFRARSTGANVRKIAETMGGGGHDQAAGLTMPTEDPYEALAEVRKQIEEVSQAT
ncbi:hypothetical protein GF389_02270 [Candidatus Dojkabacteria bacterium]|nr:hypothetical protein [Candidatus Dojkabacteria bacterium]